MITVYLDMDGCIPDFDSKTIELIGKRLRDFPDSASGWAAMENHKDIYSLLDKMPDADELVYGVQRLSYEFNFEIGVLTAIPKIGRIPLARQHKREWLKKHYPFLLENFQIGPHAEHKQFHCVPGDVLIDDSEMNIPQWNDRGGCGILHIDAKTSLEQLNRYLATNQAIKNTPI